MTECNPERLRGVDIDETYREQAPLYCTDCGHPATAFQENGHVYIGCLRKKFRASGVGWETWDTADAAPDSWEQVPHGIWPSLSQWFVRAVRSHMGVDDAE